MDDKVMDLLGKILENQTETNSQLKELTSRVQKIEAYPYNFYFLLFYRFFQFRIYLDFGSNLGHHAEGFEFTLAYGKSGQ